MPKVPVKVYWYPIEERGRKAPPSGPRYFGVIEIESQGSTSDQWSVLLELDPESGHRSYRNEMLTFLSDQAPLASLQPGVTFRLFEGRWPVAEGVVVRPEEMPSLGLSEPGLKGRS